MDITIHIAKGEAKSPARAIKYFKLPHGRVEITKHSVRLELEIALDETAVSPARSVCDESWTARQFLEKQLGGTAE